MGALLHLMDWQKVQLALEFAVAAGFLLATFGAVADRWLVGSDDGRHGDTGQGARSAAGD